MNIYSNVQHSIHNILNVYIDSSVNFFVCMRFVRCLVFSSYAAPSNNAQRTEKKAESQNVYLHQTTFSTFFICSFFWFLSVRNL